MNLRIGLVLVALGLSALGCASSDGDTPPNGTEQPLTRVDSRDGKLQLSVFTTPQPPTRGMISARLIVTDRGSARAVDGLTLAVEPHMPSMGHGTATVPRVTPKGSGTYQVDDLDLFMAGRWELRIAITGGVADAAVVPLDVR